MYVQGTINNAKAHSIGIRCPDCTTSTRHNYSPVNLNVPVCLVTLAWSSMDAVQVSKMAFPFLTAANTLTMVLLFAWTVLDTTPATKKNSILAQYFTSQVIFQQIASTVSINFAPGLWDVLRSATPPTIQYFKTLPNAAKSALLWVIYLVVLEKSGCRPKIYIGSGTQSRQGVRTRMTCYENATSTLPELVRRALQDEYKVTHIGLICWIPLPSAVQVPAIRCLFIIMEVAFTCMFWAMAAANKSHQLSSFCLWDSATLSYDGLCSHCCLNETIQGAEDILTEEELEAQAAQRLAVHNAHNKVSEAKIRAAKTYYCNTCKVAVVSEYRLGQHFETPGHINREAEMAGTRKPWKCIPCNKPFLTRAHLDRHKKTQKHRDALSSSKLG